MEKSKTVMTSENTTKKFNRSEDVEIFSTFGKEHDRFSFPCDVRRVTAGHGGEALLVVGSAANALIDCGMAYCGREMVENMKKTGLKPDYVLLSHSHYDHIGALPYIREAFPDAVICGSEKCAHILEKESARKLMKELGTEARDLYVPGSREEIPVEGLKTDRVLHDGDSIDLGDKVITAYETKGHTDCSMSFFLEPDKLLFTSESTGILEGKDYVHTPILKSFTDAAASLEKCRNLGARHVCLPHFGMLPDDFTDRFFDMFEEECKSKTGFVRCMKEEGLTEEEMLERYIKRYWNPAKEQEQPFEAFAINSRHILKALLKEINNV